MTSPARHIWCCLRRLLPGWQALLLCTLVWADWATAAQQIHRFYGYAFDSSSGEYLYTEVHQHAYEGERWLAGTIRYYSPDNQLIGEKTLDFSRDPYIPLFRLRLPGLHYEEAVTAVELNGIDMETLVNGHRLREHLPHEIGMVADSGFYSFMVDHLGEIQAGHSVRFPFAVAGRLNSYRFRLVRQEEAQVDGHPTLRIRAEADSLLRMVAPTLSFLYDLQTRYLIEYDGVSNIRNPVTGKPYSAVRVVYPGKPPLGAPAQLPQFEGG